METVYLYLILFLILVIIWLDVLLFRKRQQLFLFSSALRKRQEEGVFTPLTVQSFSDDVVELANQLNTVITNQREQHKIAIQSEDNLKRMIAGISHDFRTPLTAVMGYLQMIEKGGRLNEEDMDSLKIAEERCGHLYELADDFFELSKLSADNNLIDTDSVELTRLLVEECLLAHDWMVQKGIETEFQMSQEPVWVQGQEHALKRIIENLFSNIRKYAKDTVRISLWEETEEICLSFANGMDEKFDEEFCAHVFEPFYRSASRHRQGSGLGLYIVKCLAEKMDGHVEAFYEEDLFTVKVCLKKYIKSNNN